MQTQAVILDLDGLMINSEPLHQRAFNEYLSRHGVGYQFGEEEYGQAFVGVPVRGNADYLIRRFHLNVTPEELIEEREAIFEALIGNPENVVAMPGLYNALDKLQKRSLVLAVASASPRNQVETMLRGLGIAARFKVIVTGSDVNRPKPAPDIYELAVKRLDVPKENCLAVEDSATGVAAAKAACLRVIVVPSMYTLQQDLSLADAQAVDLEQVIAMVD